MITLKLTLHFNTLKKIFFPQYGGHNLRELITPLNRGQIVQDLPTSLNFVLTCTHCRFCYKGLFARCTEVLEYCNRAYLAALKDITKVISQHHQRTLSLLENLKGERMISANDARVKRFLKSSHSMNILLHFSMTVIPCYAMNHGAIKSLLWAAAFAQQLDRLCLH